MSPRAKVVGLAMMLGVPILFALGVPIFLWIREAPAWVPLLGLGALLVVGVARVAGRGLGRSLAAALSLAAVAPLVLVAYDVLRSPIFTDRDGVGLRIFAYGVYFLPGYAGWAVITLALSLVPKPALARWMRGAALAVMSAAALAVVLALLKRAVHVDTDGLRARLEPVCDLGESRRCERDDYVLEEDAHKTAPYLHRTYRITEKATGLSDVLPVAPAWRLRTTRLWIVVKGDEAGVWSDGYAGPPFAPRAATFAAFARECAPPMTWTACAAIGLAVALLLARWRGVEAVLRARLSWREELRPTGPVLVNPAARSPSYRESACDESVPGALADVRDELARHGLERWSSALLVVSLTAAPLLVAAALGFLR